MQLKDPPPFQFPNINVERTYRVRLIAGNQTLRCMDSTEKIIRVLNHCLIEVPTAFTPNNDGLNDWFSPHNALKAINYNFRVFNRWGQLVFETNDKQAFWNGRYKGNLQPTETYVWTAEGTDKQGAIINRRGQTILLR